MKDWVIIAATVFAMVLAVALTHHTGPAALEKRESLYNNIYVYRKNSYFIMMFGYNKTIYEESVFNKDDERELPVTYTQYMTLGLAYAGPVKSILEIGSGGGRTTWYLHRFLPEVAITSVELDPAVVELARKYFGIRDERNYQTVNSDGRIFLTHAKERYDVILLDAYRGPFVPFHLLTREFYQLVKEHLNPGGVIVQNIDPTTMLFDSAVKTMHEVFPHLDFFPADANMVVVAYDGPARAPRALERLADDRQASAHLRYDLRQMLAHRREFDPDDPEVVSPSAKILTDDFAPVEALKAIKKHNQKWQNP